jgi:hypothetical protein
MKNKRIILDTNIWISFLISKNYTEIDNLILTSGFTLLFSNESLEEFIEVVNRPKFKKFFSKRDVEKLLSLFDQYAELIVIQSNTHICRDPKDNFLLDLAIDGKADFLITGDKDLLVVGKISGIQIITFQDFLKEITSD